MTNMQSEIARLMKTQENITCVDQKGLMETEEELAPILDLKCKNISAVFMKKFKVLMEIQDLMFEEIRGTLKNDLKEILRVENIVPEVKSSENSNSREEKQQIKDEASLKTGLAEKIGGNAKVVEDIESLISERKIDELSSKIGKDSGEDKLVKEMGNGNKLRNFTNEEKIPKASRQEKDLLEEGAVLTLAADFSSAALDISKQWSNTFNILRENDFEPKFLCQLKLAFTCDGEIKTFSDLKSLRTFISQKSVMKELLKDVFPQNEERRYEIQREVGNILTDSKHGVGETASDGLSFLFVKEVKVAKPGEVQSLEAQKEESSAWKKHKTPKLEEEEASEVEDVEEMSSGLEEEEEGGEEISELEEEEEEEGEETSELEEEEEEEILGLEVKDSTSQGRAVVDTKYEVEELTDDGSKTVFMDKEKSGNFLTVVLS
ncbi:LINE-1 type transposase domain-containing protein 1 [Tupaia chinensis]|uniref:LINE-1 type transposase domain-containing protein 1 n=1 Tax=Tupaia chinensis TaxID=246437 RepID=UPI0003C9022B|nr:LINE-1 type transposase domain-containing protein 1 [Tupaia chinensis]